MNKIVLSLLFVSAFGFSQIEKTVGDFNKVTSFDQIDVLLVKANENKVILNGNNSDQVELINNNGELKIRLAATKMLKGDNISATVYYKNIDALEANEGSRIASNELLSGLVFDIIVKEGSKIDLQNLEVDKLSVRTSSGSEVTIKGTVKNQEIIANAGGKYFGEKCVSNQTTVTVNAGGEATVYATDFVDAKTRAGGSILIYGKPKQINEKKVAGGSIKQAK